MVYIKKIYSDQYFLEEAPIGKMIAHLSIPMMIGMSVGTIYSVINAFFIGLLHNIVMLSAITLGIPIFTVLMTIGNVLGVGGGTFTARLAGERDFEKVKRVAGYTFWGSLISGIILFALVILFINPIVHLLGSNKATFTFAKQYAVALFAGGFAIILNFSLEQLVRSEGASKESMYGIFVSTALSLILDPLLILGLGWHVVGAAVAMCLANLGSSIYYIYYLDKKSANLKGFLKNFKLSLKDQMEIYKIGLSELFQSAFMIVTSLLLNHYAISYGSGVIASFGVAVRIAQVPEFLSMGLFLGLIPFFATNFGSKNFARFRAGARQAFAWIGIVSVVFVGTVFIFREPIFKLFSNDASLLSIGALVLTAQAVSALFNGYTGMFMGIFQATGQGMPTMVMGIAQGILVIPVIILMNRFFGMHGLIWSLTIAEVFTFILGFVFYMSFKNKLLEPKVL